MTRIISIIVAVLIVVVFVLIAQKKEQRQTLSYSVFWGEKGWGYNILINTDIFIHQETIPALPVKNGFETKHQATKAAKLVVSKIKAGLLPVVHSDEISKIISSKFADDQQRKSN